MSTVLETVKPRIGVFYTTPLKDLEIQSMIDEAEAFMRGAGFPETEIEEPLGIAAIVIYCKMATSTDANTMVNNPMWISILAQARAVVEVVV